MFILHHLFDTGTEYDNYINMLKCMLTSILFFFTNRLYWLYLLYSSIAKVFLLDLSMEVAVILTLIPVHHLFDVMWDSGDPLTIDQHLMNGLSACNRHLCLCYNKA